jgi:DNA recombination protein RmuC
MNLWIISTLLVIIIFLLIWVIYVHTKNDPNKVKNEESIRDIDRAIERQEGTLSDLTKDIQSFQDPLDKLRRYLSGGTLAGKFGEWSLEAIMQDIFHSNQYVKNAEVIKGSGKRVEFVLKMPEGLLLPIDAKFPSGLYDSYLLSVEHSDDRAIKKSIDDIKRHVIKDASDIQEKYIQSGITIDLGIMYIPSESLMQLIDSIENIREIIFRDSRVLIMGPNSLAAYLISVHMGFRTLALNNRAGEIMEEFGKLKKEFEKFGSSTDDLLKKADAMIKAVNEHSTRERQMSKGYKEYGSTRFLKIKPSPHIQTKK